MIDKARHQPVKPVAVFISTENFAHYEKLEDEYWAKKIDERRSSGGYLSNDESLDALIRTSIMIDL